MILSSVTLRFLVAVTSLLSMAVRGGALIACRHRLHHVIHRKASITITTSSTSDNSDVHVIYILYTLINEEVIDNLPQVAGASPGAAVSDWIRPTSAWTAVPG